jgi:hypothetical protein
MCFLSWNNLIICVELWKKNLGFDYFLEIKCWCMNYVLIRVVLFELVCDLNEVQD